MIRKVLAFVSSVLALPLAAALAYSAWAPPPFFTGIVVLGFILLIIFCAIATLFRLPVSATIAGLLVGGLLFDTSMIILDWALVHPKGEPLTLAGFIQYIGLYARAETIGFLLGPFFLSAAAFFAGRSLALRIARSG